MDKQDSTLSVAAVKEEAGDVAGVGFGGVEAADEGGEEAVGAVEGGFEVVDDGGGGGVGEEEPHLEVFKKEDLKIGGGKGDLGR